jgi:hypothetical protein
MLDASKSLSHQMSSTSTSIKSPVKAVPLGINIPNVAFTLQSRDRGMNTRLIAADLLRSYLSCGGIIKTKIVAKSVAKSEITAINSAGETTVFKARHIILAAGKSNHLFNDKIKILISPILVVAPALTDINFVHVSPHLEQTINHIYHRYEGIDYSVIRGATYYDAQTATAEFMRRASSRLFRLAKKVFSDVGQAKAAIFYGYKTELAPSSSIGRALYHIRDYENYTLALRGKFSICFGLAANVCRHFGIEPVRHTRMLHDIVVEQLIEFPRHFDVARQLAFEANPQRPHTLGSARRSRERNVPAAGY